MPDNTIFYKEIIDTEVEKALADFIPDISELDPDAAMLEEAKQVHNKVTEMLIGGMLLTAAVDYAKPESLENYLKDKGLDDVKDLAHYLVGKDKDEIKADFKEVLFLTLKKEAIEKDLQAGDKESFTKALRKFLNTLYENNLKNLDMFFDKEAEEFGIENPLVDDVNIDIKGLSDRDLADKMTNACETNCNALFSAIYNCVSSICPSEEKVNRFMDDFIVGLYTTYREDIENTYKSLSDAGLTVVEFLDKLELYAPDPISLISGTMTVTAGFASAKERTSVSSKYVFSKFLESVDNQFEKMLPGTKGMDPEQKIKACFEAWNQTSLPPWMR